MRGHDLGAALVAIAIAHLFQFLADHLHEAFGVTEDLQQLLNGLEDFLVLVYDLVLLQARETVQAHIQNRLGLGGRQAIDCGLGDSEVWVNS